MSDAYVGEIRIWPVPRVPTAWAYCDGSLLPISQFQAVFSLLGTTYGGDGVQTFGLPDLRNKLPIHQGQGPGLTSRVIGEAAGVPSVTLLSANLPLHNHLLQASLVAGSATTVNGQMLATAPAGVSEYAQANGPGAITPLAPATVGMAGGSQPHPNVMPGLGIGFIICLEGLFPPRQ